MEEECSLCLNPLDYRIVYPCNHNNICPSCYLTLRLCYNSKKCYFCQKEIAVDPIIYKGELKSYSEIIELNPKHNNEFKIFYFDEDTIQYVSSFFLFKCPKCEKKFSEIEQYSSHLHSHLLNICLQCHKSNRFLPINMPIFNDQSYSFHVQHHPKCLVCPYIAFDQNSLSHHMIENHVRCNICANHFSKILWFHDEKALGDHNIKTHWVCDHPECSRKNLTAFATEQELLEHRICEHHDLKAKLYIDAHFDHNVIETTPVVPKSDFGNFVSKRFQLKLENIFGDDIELIDHLKQGAQLYAQSQITALQFYTLFVTICGESSSLLFTDMVALLPIQSKRIELTRLNDNPPAELIKKMEGKTDETPENQNEEPPQVDNQEQQQKNRKKKKGKHTVFMSF